MERDPGDRLWYTLGVTPAAPGFTTVRVAPRLGRLIHAQGSVPTPYGRLSVEVTPDLVLIDSPVRVELDLEGQPLRALEAGRHEVRRRSPECPML